MASPSSTTTQSQGGTDTSVTRPLSATQSESSQTTPATLRTNTTRARPDFTITFTFKPSSPPKGTPISV